MSKALDVFVCSLMCLIGIVTSVFLIGTGDVVLGICLMIGFALLWVCEWYLNK